MDIQFLSQMYYRMLRIRSVEEKIAELYPEQEMRCPVHLSIGQEAVAVGACTALEPKDYVLSTHRSHAHYLAKDGDLKAMLAEIYGKETGCCQGKGGSMHLIDLSVDFLGAVPIVGSTLPIAVGSAFASAMKNESRITLVFFGEGATEEGVFHESINFAALHKLGVVFVCENNLYSVYTPLSDRQPGTRKVYEMVRGQGITSYHGDGNNVEDVYSLVKQGVEEARSGQGPVFVELDTYRWREHCGPFYDNDLGYRTEAEYLAWRERDPIGRLEEQLLSNGVLNHRKITEMKVNLDLEIREAFTFAKESPFPDQALLFEHIYSSS